MARRARGGSWTSAAPTRPSAAWLRGDHQQVSVDLDPRGLAPGRGVCASALALPFADATFDVVAAFDVVEHCEPEALAVAELARVLAPGGRLLLSVPAYQWAWSDHDVRAGHHRRYTRPRIVAALEAAGLRVERSTYAFALVFPMFAAERLAAPGASPPPPTGCRPCHRWRSGCSAGCARPRRGCWPGATCRSARRCWSRPSSPDRSRRDREQRPGHDLDHHEGRHHGVEVAVDQDVRRQRRAAAPRPRPGRSAEPGPGPSPPRSAPAHRPRTRCRSPPGRTRPGRARRPCRTPSRAASARPAPRSRPRARRPARCRPPCRRARGAATPAGRRPPGR